MNKKRNFISGAVVLAVCGLIAKIIGALYRIPLTNILSAEGMGMYQLVFSIYALLLSISTSGIPIAISRLVAERNALNQSSKSVLKSAILIITGFSIVMAAGLMLFGQNIAGFQGNIAIKLGYTIIAPAIIFVGGLALFRGWFQGNYNVVPTAVSQLIEQSVKLILGLALAYYLLPRGIIYAVYGALAGVTFSEIAAFFYILISYLVKKKKTDYDMPVMPDIPLKTTVKELTLIALPIAIGGLIVPFSQFIDSILIVNLLKSGGFSTKAATAAYGLFSGTVMSLINMPIVLTLSLAVVIVPIVSANRVNRNLEGIIQKSATSIKLSYVIGLPASLLMFIYARPLLLLLYPRLAVGETELAVGLLRITAFSIIFQSQMQIYTSLLQALDKTYAPVKNLLVAVFFKTVISVLLLKSIGINGAAVGTLTLGLIATTLNIITFNNLVGKNVKLVQNVSTILASSVIMSMVALIFYFALNESLVSLIVGSALSIVVYFLMLMLFKVFENGELEGVPLLKYFERFSTKIRFWENR